MHISLFSFQCAIAVDNLASYYFNNITMGEAPSTPAAIRFAQHIADCPSLFPEVTFHASQSLFGRYNTITSYNTRFSLTKQILKTLFEIVLFEDCGNQWSLSRPMLSLILISEQVYIYIYHSCAVFSSEMAFVVNLFQLLSPDFL